LDFGTQPLVTNINEAIATPTTNFGIILVIAYLL